MTRVKVARVKGRWTNASVIAFGDDVDPVEAITERALGIVVGAMDAGWAGPPFDPIALADYLKLDVMPSDDVREARTVSVGRGKTRIEFNPNRPRGRMRYSIAHEIAHTLFPDFADRIRHRAEYHELKGDEWQLEALCNIAAAEFLMPLGSLPTITTKDLDIDHLMEFRRRYEVSPEALLIRIARVTDEPCAVFCATRLEQGPKTDSYRLDYMIGSRAWPGRLVRSALLPPRSVVVECTAIGFTAKADEIWEPIGCRLHVECVGIPSFPGAKYPRVVGIITGAPAGTRRRVCITYLKGSATEPRGDGPKLVAHIVNDATPNWGGSGFAQAVRRKWPRAQQGFRDWAAQHRRTLSLGNVHFATVEGMTVVASMVAQKGYGPSKTPRVRYAALRACLTRIAQAALERGASVHMPRIGCGQGGGSWDIVHELISSTLCAAGVPVFVYDLPGATVSVSAQRSLDLAFA